MSNIKRIARVVGRVLLTVAAVPVAVYVAFAPLFGWPHRNPHVQCQHCASVGTVMVWRQKVKRGISGGKATGAILTGGVSMLATGLSRKQTVTMMRCDRCLVKSTVE